MNNFIQISLVLFGLWLVSWLIAALWSDRAAKRASIQSEMVYRLLTVAGALLIFWHAGEGARLWTMPAWVGGLLLAVEVLGYAFCWWARIHLGRLWSATVGAKSEHRIIDTGPYRLVRHPIYTGLIASLIAMALIQARAQALAGAAVMIYSFWIKARLEERFLRQTLGAEAYDAYSRRTPMLIPFLRLGGQ
ncbi:MAG: putative protein-S-isoprenylcysteine methyltransferase [Caulobacteraceae bacterium]|nr:putative protein-S-isoprenylcysteine methyltransferase [Caulobacteraceae bacterium]